MLNRITSDSGDSRAAFFAAASQSTSHNLAGMKTHPTFYRSLVDSGAVGRHSLPPFIKCTSQVLAGMETRPTVINNFISILKY